MDLKSSIAYLLKDGKGLSVTSIQEILKAVLGVKEKELATALKEMEKKKEITRNEDLIEATARAKRRIPRLEKESYDLPLWHRNWTMIIFNVPENKKSLRDQIRYQLKKEGFAVWKNSVWVSPKELSAFLKNFFENHNLKKEVKVFKALLSKEDEEELLKEAWSLKDIEKRYKKFVNTAKRSFARLKSLDFIDEELKRKALDLLAKITQIEYLNIIKKDPRLPRLLLPRDWIGYRAYRIYQQLDKYLS